MDNIVIYTFIVVSAIGTIISLFDTFLFLPKKLKDKIVKNRLQESIEILKEFGIKPEIYTKTNIASKIDAEVTGDLRAQVNTTLNNFKEDIPVNIGKINSKPLKYYIDLIGASTNPKNSELFARYLTTFWRETVTSNTSVKNLEFDFVVTPKQGSPIIGYEFARKMEKPFIIYSREEKFSTADDNFKKHFDCEEIPPKGKTAIIVDDSTTGGRMMKEVIKALKSNGYTITECLVIFEPTVKDARGILQGLGVNLHSIVKINNHE